MAEPAKRLDFHGRLVDQPRIRAGFIGCGSHAFRNIYPTFQFAPVELVATCDLDLSRAQAFARQFGAERAYDDHRRMLGEEKLDAVFIVTGYDRQGRPLHAQLALEAVQAGLHVWMEKPPAAGVDELLHLRRAAAERGRHIMVGFKKSFMPANRKAGELMRTGGFSPHLLMLQYPLEVPTVQEFEQAAAGQRVNVVVGFLDHLCHPVSLMVDLFGLPQRLHYVRSSHGGGVATFSYADGRIATLAMTAGQSMQCDPERTAIVGTDGRHITVENNRRVTLHRFGGSVPYGASPDFFVAAPEQAPVVWEPEFSLGQLYNKGLFLIGYYDEVNAFARGILDGQPSQRGSLDQAIDVTAVYEAFAQGPDRPIDIRRARSS